MKKVKKEWKVESIPIFHSSHDRNEMNFGPRLRNFGYIGNARRRISIGETQDILHGLIDEELSRESFKIVKEKFNEYRSKNEDYLKKIKQHERRVLSKSKEYFIDLQKIREKLFPELTKGPVVIPDFKSQDFPKSLDLGVDTSDDIFDQTDIEGSSMDEKEEKILQISALRQEMEELRSSFFSSKNRALCSLNNQQKNLRYSMYRLEGLSEEYQSKLLELSKREERNYEVEIILKKRGERLESLLEDLDRKEKKLKDLKYSIKKKIEEEEKLRNVIGTERRHRKRIEDREKEIHDLELSIVKSQEDLEKIKIEKHKTDQGTEKLKLSLSELEGKLEAVLQKLEEEKNNLPTPTSPISDQEEEGEGDDEYSDSDEEEEEEEEKEEPLGTPRSDPVNKTLKFVEMIESPSKVQADEGFEEISRDVEEFKSEFTDLFNSIDVVKKRMAFYSSDLNKSNSARIRGPRGHVTIIFTSVEGSHEIWDRDVELMLKCMEIHNRIVRTTLTESNGYEVKTEGDTFMISFHKINEALKFALNCQLRLNEVHWPKKLGWEKENEEGLIYPACKTERDPKTGHTIFRGLRVSMGVHDGRPICERDPVTKRTDYFGPMVNKSARIGSCATGGAIAISQSVYNGIRHYVGTGIINNQEVQKFGCKVHMRTLGRRKLKGVGKEETIRWLFPEELKYRAHLLLEKVQKEEKTRKESDDNNNRLDQIIDVLNEKRLNLDRRRTKITSKIGYELKLKSLESSNAEKEELITYLRRKMKDLKCSYERAVELKQTSLNEEDGCDDDADGKNKKKGGDDESNSSMIIKKDVESVIEKYKKMQDMYASLKGSFSNVEEVFSNRLKDELKKFQGDLVTMKEKFLLQKNRNVFDRKIWEVQKKILKTKIKHCEEAGEKQAVMIQEIHDKIKSVNCQIENRRKQMVREHRKKMRYQEKKKKFLLMEQKIEKNLEDGKVLALLRNTTIQLGKGLDDKSSSSSTSGQVIVVNRSNGMNDDNDNNNNNNRSDRQESLLSWKDDMVVSNTSIFLPQKQRKKQDEMVGHDTMFLDDIRRDVNMILKSPMKKKRKKNNYLNVKMMNINDDDDDDNNSMIEEDYPSFTVMEKKQIERKIERMQKKYKNLESRSQWFSEKSKLLRIKKKIRKVSELIKKTPVKLGRRRRRKKNNSSSCSSHLQILNSSTEEASDYSNVNSRFSTPTRSRRTRTRSRRRRMCFTAQKTRNRSNISGSRFLGSTVTKPCRNRYGKRAKILESQGCVSDLRRPRTSNEPRFTTPIHRRQRKRQENVFLPNIHEHPVTDSFWGEKDEEVGGGRGKGDDDADDNDNWMNEFYENRRFKMEIRRKKRRGRRRRRRKKNDTNFFFLKSTNEDDVDPNILQEKYNKNASKFRRWNVIARRKYSSSTMDHTIVLERLSKLVKVSMEEHEKRKISSRTLRKVEIKL